MVRIRHLEKLIKIHYKLLIYIFFITLISSCKYGKTQIPNATYYANGESKLYTFLDDTIILNSLENGTESRFKLSTRSKYLEPEGLHIKFEFDEDKIFLINEELDIRKELKLVQPIDSLHKIKKLNGYWEYKVRSHTRWQYINQERKILKEYWRAENGDTLTNPFFYKFEYFTLFDNIICIKVFNRKNDLALIQNVDSQKMVLLTINSNYHYSKLILNRVTIKASPNIYGQWKSFSNSISGHFPEILNLDTLNANWNYGLDLNEIFLFQKSKEIGVYSILELNKDSLILSDLNTENTVLDIQTETYLKEL